MHESGDRPRSPRTPARNLIPSGSSLPASLSMPTGSISILPTSVGVPLRSDPMAVKCLHHPSPLVGLRVCCRCPVDDPQYACPAFRATDQMKPEQLDTRCTQSRMQRCRPLMRTLGRHAHQFFAATSFMTSISRSRSATSFSASSCFRRLTSFA